MPDKCPWGMGRLELTDHKSEQSTLPMIQLSEERKETAGNTYQEQGVYF